MTAPSFRLARRPQQALPRQHARGMPPSPDFAQAANAAVDEKLSLESDNFLLECGSLSMNASQPSSNLETSRRLLEQGQNGARHTVTVYRSALGLAPAKRRRWHA